MANFARITALSGVMGAILLGSCSSDAPPVGGLMLMIGRDGPLPIDRLELQVVSKEQTLLKNSYRVPKEAKLPTTLAIASNGDPHATVDIAVTGWQGDIPLDRRDAIVTQVPTDRVAALAIILSGRCTPKVVLESGEARSSCGSGRTCDPATGNCIGSEVDATTLPSYTQGAEDDLSPGNGEGGNGAGGVGPGPEPGGASSGGASPGGASSGGADAGNTGIGGSSESGAGGMGSQCGKLGTDCTSGEQCCSHYCEGTRHCGIDPAACTADGAGCGADEDCCGGICDQKTCLALNGACKTLGNPCLQNADCCSGLCGGNHTCALSSYCAQTGDSCVADGNCCGGRCDKAAGAGVGICGNTEAVNANCTGAAGTLCGSCGDCCSRLCVPYAPTGLKICAPSNGCRASGELCHKDKDCCGGDPNDTSLPGYSNVICDIAAGATFGRCKNPINGAPNPDGACNPQGNICYYKDYSCSVSSARASCCDSGGNFGVCRIDDYGVPRCNGLGDNCRAANETCTSNPDCCSQHCVPDAAQVLRCSDAACQAEGKNCTVDGDCCVGTQCYREVGKTAGYCVAVPQGQSCNLYGQICAAPSDCCDGVPCTNNRCLYPLE